MWDKIEAYICGKVQLSSIILAEKYFWKKRLLRKYFCLKKRNQNEILLSVSFIHINVIKKNEAYVWIVAR